MGPSNMDLHLSHLNIKVFVSELWYSNIVMLLLQLNELCPDYFQKLKMDIHYLSSQWAMGKTGPLRPIIHWKSILTLCSHTVLTLCDKLCCLFINVFLLLYFHDINNKADVHMLVDWHKLYIFIVSTIFLVYVYLSYLK